MKLNELFLIEGDLSHWDRDGNGFLVGYRVVNIDDDGNLVSQADSRVKLPARVGVMHEIPGGGMYVSNSKDYVKDYYWHGNEDPEDPIQALMTYSFSLEDILEGNPHDREPELSIRRGKVLNIQRLED
jgi:hypothetical protein